MKDSKSSLRKQTPTGKSGNLKLPRTIFNCHENILGSHFLIVCETPAVPVKLSGNCGFLKYVQFWVTSLPDSLTKKTQQTPKLKQQQRDGLILGQNIFYLLVILPWCTVSSRGSALLCAFRGSKTSSISSWAACASSGEGQELAVKCLPLHVMTLICCLNSMF